MKLIVNKLRGARERLRMGQEELGEVMGKKQASMSLMEGGKRVTVPTALL